MGYLGSQQLDSREFAIRKNIIAKTGLLAKYIFHKRLFVIIVSVVQWSGFYPSKVEVRVRFPADTSSFFPQLFRERLWFNGHVQIESIHWVMDSRHKDQTTSWYQIRPYWRRGWSPSDQILPATERERDRNLTGYFWSSSLSNPQLLYSRHFTDSIEHFLEWEKREQSKGAGKWAKISGNHYC